VPVHIHLADLDHELIDADHLADPQDTESRPNRAGFVLSEVVR